MICAKLSTVYMNTSCIPDHQCPLISSSSDYSLHGSCRFIFHRWCYCREDRLYRTGYLTDNHMFNYYIRHFCGRVFCASPLRPPPLLSLPFPYFPWDHCYSPTLLHPKLPHAVPGLTDCVAAASAEITTQHPGREQPADGIDYLYCQNN